MEIISGGKGVKGGVKGDRRRCGALVWISEIFKRLYNFFFWRPALNSPGRYQVVITPSSGIILNWLPGISVFKHNGLYCAHAPGALHPLLEVTENRYFPVCRPISFTSAGVELTLWGFSWANVVTDALDRLATAPLAFTTLQCSVSLWENTETNDSISISILFTVSLSSCISYYVESFIISARARAHHYHHIPTTIKAAHARARASARLLASRAVQARVPCFFSDFLT